MAEDFRLVYFDHVTEDFLGLTRQLDAELNDRNGPWQAEYDVYNKLDGIRDVVLAYDGATPVGCASMKRFDDAVFEVKRVFVVPEARGRGLAKQLMARLESEAAARGILALVLETADTLVAAHALYRSLGYNLIDNYGQYRGKPHSLCFGKRF